MNSQEDNKKKYSRKSLIPLIIIILLVIIGFVIDHLMTRESVEETPDFSTHETIIFTTPRVGIVSSEGGAVMFSGPHETFFPPQNHYSRSTRLFVLGIKRESLGDDWLIVEDFETHLSGWVKAKSINF